MQGGILEALLEERDTLVAIIVLRATAQPYVDKRIALDVEILIVVLAEAVIVVHGAVAVRSIPFVVAHDIVALHIFGQYLRVVKDCFEVVVLAEVAAVGEVAHHKERIGRAGVSVEVFERLSHLVRLSAGADMSIAHHEEHGIALKRLVDDHFGCLGSVGGHAYGDVAVALAFLHCAGLVGVVLDAVEGGHVDGREP